MPAINLMAVIVIMATASAEQTPILPSDTSIRYFGRVDRSRVDRVLFDWPGIVIQTEFEGTSCRATFEGVDCFDAFVDGVLTKRLQCGSKKATFVLAMGLENRRHSLLLVKRSESTSGRPTSFFGFTLEKEKSTFPPRDAPPARKIEFIGDSYTAGFANEYPSRECPAGKEDSLILATTNTDKAFGPITARAFGAQYHIIAISGKGLVRNYNGIDKGKELPVYYDRTLISSVNSPGISPAVWDFSQWKADVAVVGIGINDFQGDPPYADSTAFDAAYNALIDRLRKQYPGVKIICCATRVWPTDALIARIRSIVAHQKTSGRTDIFYYEYFTENGALYGHPSIHDHRIIADGLIPVIARATGWQRTDLAEGK